MRLTIKGTGLIDCEGTIKSLGKEKYRENYRNKSVLAHAKLGQLEDIEDGLGIDLVIFLKGVNPNTCFMEITKNKKFDFCGDAYHGTYTKEGLLKLIQNLLFMYWALTKEELGK